MSGTEEVNLRRRGRRERDTEEGAHGVGDDEAAAEEGERRGWFGRLRESLSASRQALTRELPRLTGDPLPATAWRQEQVRSVR